jgi:hypothetical protein
MSGTGGRFARSQGNIVARVLSGGWSDRCFCLPLVGDLRPDRCSCQVGAANYGQIVSSLAIFRIFERDTLCDVHGGAVSWECPGRDLQFHDTMVELASWS